MRHLVKLLRFLAPVKGRIVLVVFLSMLTSVLGAVSIYSILPLLNEIFRREPQVAAAPAVPAPSDVSGGLLSGRLIDAAELQHWAIGVFHNLFAAETRPQTLLKICMFLIAAFALKNFFLYLNDQLIYRIQTRVSKDLRDSVFRSIIEMHLDYFNKQRVGGLMNNVFNDVESVKATVNVSFVNFVKNPFSIVVYLGVLLVLSWKLTLFAFGVSILILIIIRFIGERLKSLAHMFRLRLGDMNSVLNEKFGGIKLIKSSAFEDVELERFKVFTRDFRRLDIRIFSLQNMISPLNETMLIGAVAMVLWFGGLQVFEGSMAANELLVFAFSLYSVMGPVKSLGEAFSGIQTGSASAERLLEVMEAEPAVKNGTKAITGFSKSICFEDVSFRYRHDDGSRPVLDRVSFEILKGEVVALVGQSGSGKSTVVDLLLRFYDVDEGRITIDGVDIREFDYKQLRSMIGVVSQEVILFNDTIERNIAYGVHGEVGHDRVVQAARLANAHAFIEEKPEQYGTVIGDRGVQLSGGQRQRLAIARAMVKNPDLLIFDEATSALDNESEKVVQDAIDHALSDRTALVVAHRLSTIRNANRIVVLERGRVVESGSHEELLAVNGLYRKFYDIQFSGQPAEA
ncbi:MAG: ABC transporter ATP-binding protein [Chlorobiaceae bacterium]|nr:ABC transporter ATP-binding protein [Chlorobiaceae bacterium]